MARSTPRVDGTVLVGQDAAPGSIVVGSSAWYAWLEDASTFAFTGSEGTFTARKERRGRAGWYWKAYRKQAGRVRSAYLGKSADLTIDRMRAVALALATPPPAATHDPVGVPSAPPSLLPTGTVTFLFSDIEGSTQRWEQHPQAMSAALARHDALMRQAITAHAGVVFKMVGDGVHAAFARATDALSAALAAQRALHAESWSELGALRVRMAAHSGTAELRDADYFGPPLNRVARILALGHGGQVLLSRATHDLVADDLPAATSLRALGEYPLKDLSRPEQLFQLVTPDLPADFPPLRSPIHGSEGSGTAAAPLLATKLHIPAPRLQMMPRPHLMAQLNTALLGKLTLISAPAGFGKTTLLSAWVAAWREQHSLRDDTVSASPTSARVAWVSLDPSDSDPLQFWCYVIAALDRLQPDIGASALALLQSPQPPPIEKVLIPLLNSLSMLPADAVLVLDDYHLIDAPPIHRSLTFLIDHLPPQLHLMLTTRSDPPLPLTRLRAQSALTELRAADLRFTTEETARFLTERMRLPLSDDAVSALEARTEGWIAGLQFAALAMRDHADLAGFVAAFTGSHRFIVDYLVEEVLARQPAHLQTFLLQTAILDRMCGPLCDAILGLEAEDWAPEQGGDARAARRPPPAAQAYSQIILGQLERANLFVVSLDDDRHWYRYHHLFAELLRERLLSGATRASVAALHHRASVWFEQHALGAEAIQHALAGHDWDRAAGLIEQHTWPVMFRGQIQTALGWFDALPAALLRARPVLCVLQAVMLMHTNQLDAAEAQLDDAERAISADTPEERARLVQGMIQTTRSNICFYRGDLPSCALLAQQALALLPESASIPRTAAMALMAQTFLSTGDVRFAAERQVMAVAPAARAADNRFVLLRAFTLLAQLQVLQGRLRAAATTYRQAAQVAPEPGELQRLIGSAAYSFGLGDLCREWNDLAAAEAHLAGGMEQALGEVTPNAVYVGMGSIALARLQYASGDYPSARLTLERLADIGRAHGFAPLVLARGAAMQAQLALAQGDLAAGLAWAEASGLHADDEVSYLHEAEYLALARLSIALGRDTPGQLLMAGQLLERLMAAAEAGGRMGSAIEILSLRALALHARGDLPAALSAITRALALAAPEGYMRLFVDEGAPMAALLHQALAHGIVPSYVGKLLAAFPQLDGQGAEVTPLRPVGAVAHLPLSAMVEPLSDRELEILRLIAAGHANQAIADRLIIAVGTVKKHINNIYGKLDVQSRTQALARARDLRVL